MTPEQRELFAKLDDIHLLSILIWGEARGENLMGKFAVGFVPVNRSKDGRWPKRLPDVILQDKQFSCFNEGDPNFPKLVELAETPRTANKDIVWRECQLAAFAAVCGWCRDPTHGANHYNTTGVDPKWDDNMVLAALIGNHQFFRA